MKAPEHLLLLEDCTSDALLLTRQIIAEWPQCEVVVIANRDEFVARLDNQKFDVILSDYRIPGFSGLGALALAREKCPEVPFLFISGAIGDDVAVESLKAGATDYVLKDSLARLVPAIRRALNEAAERVKSHLAEMKLRQSEEQYRELFENAIDLIHIVSPHGRFLYVNRAWRQALEYSEEEVARLTIFEVVHPEYHDQCRARFRCSKPEKDAPPWEVVFLTKYGRHLYVEGNVSAWILSGQFAGTRGIFRDVTERRLAAIALRNSHRQYESLVNSLDGILWQAELPPLRFTFVSRQAERLLGFPIHRWLNEPNFWLNHIHPADRRIAETIISAGPAGQRYRSFEYRMITADGRTVWLRDTISPPDEKAPRSRVQGIMVDITERKQAEEAVRSIQVKLEQSNETLQRKNEEIQNFYHTLSHELKTPLTSTREFISIVMDGLAGPLTDTQREYLGIARDSCNQLRVCINDLIDATRVETGKLAIHLQPTSLRHLIQQVVTTMKSAAAEKKITLAQELEPDLPDLPLDPNRMTQVITNLLNNAIKYTPPGGEVLVEAHGRAAEPELIQVSVRDTGCGVPRHEQARIFDRLYQVKTGDATTEQGVGLGLYLCRELVQLHGGRIWVESDLGKGSTFAFVLPKSARASLSRPDSERVPGYDSFSPENESTESEITSGYEKNTNN